MIRTDRRLKICTFLIVFLLIFIWGNSLLPGEISGAFSDWVKSLLIRILPAGVTDVSSGSGLLRKAAHFTEYTALGMCLTWRMGMLGRPWLRGVCWGAGAACVDETIQRFVPDRGPSLRDVGIDTCGVITGTLLLLLFFHLCQRRKKTE